MRSNRTTVIVWLVAGGIAAAITSSTPNPIPFLILASLNVYLGLRILERLNLVPTADGITGHTPDHYLNIEIDAFYERAYSVWFVDGAWQSGRTFVMAGSVISSLEPSIEGLQLSKRVEVHIHTLPGWFDEARIGYVREKGSCYIGLPIQLAQQVLDDLRRDSFQIATLGFKVEKAEAAKPCFPIYLFEMEQKL